MITIYSFALGQVAVILSGEETISVTSNNPFDISAMVNQDLRTIWLTAYPPFTLKNRPSIAMKTVQES